MNISGDPKLPFITYERERRMDLHGLWPQYNTKNYPFCRVVPFNKEATDSHKLNEYWCSDKGANTIFWEHGYGINTASACLISVMNTTLQKGTRFIPMVKEKDLIFKYFKTTQTPARFHHQNLLMEPQLSQ